MEFENEDGEIENFDDESRVITIELNDFFVVSVYVPVYNSEFSRQRYRLDFDENFYNFIEKLNSIKDVIICGDFNVCYYNRDISNLERHRKIKMFSDEEKAGFRELLNLEFIDTYRYLHPSSNEFTFWTHNVEDRENTVWGWRLDYILVSAYLEQNIRKAKILKEIKGSDHCPIEAEIDI